MDVPIMANSIKDVNISDNARVHMGNHYEYRYEPEDPLRHLPFASNAPFNASYREHDSDCLAGTRVDILQRICQWVDGEDKSCIFWLSGWPGTGKSAIARTVARSYQEEGRLAASFFFSRGGGDSSHAGLFVASVARQLADCKALDVRDRISDSVKEHSQVLSQTLQDQWNRLVLQPLSRCGKNATSNVFLLVVDALDECEDERSIRTLLNLLPRLSELAEIHMKVLVTSRLGTPIRHGFKRMGRIAHHDFALHHIPREVTDRDLEVFFDFQLSQIAEECCLSSEWPGRQTLALMVQQAQGLFIWAETACRYVREGGGRLAKRRLDALMDHSNSTIVGPTEHLDGIYTTILHGSVPKAYNGDERKMAYDFMRLVLGTIVVLSSTLSAVALSELLNLTIYEVSQTIEELRSILDVPKDVTHPLRLHHDSFRNFLMNETCCQDENVLVNKREAHARLVTGCINVMSSVLKENICEQGKPGVLLRDADTNLIQRRIPQQVQYACLYWVSHVVESGQQLTDDDEVHKFFQTQIIHWIEAMSWMGKTSEAIKALAPLEVITKDERCATLHALAHDTKRFLIHARSGIQQAPLQTYVSASLFAPSRSIVRRLSVCTTLVDCVKRSPRALEHWSAMLMTLEGHSSWVVAVQFSRDGSRLASVSYDGKVIVWDPNTGALLQTLDTGAFVSDMAFSANESFLQTNIDGFDLGATLSSPSGGEAWSPHLQVQGSLWHGHKTMWSPPEYLLSRRSDAAHEPIVAFRRSSGAIYAVDDDGQHSPDENRNSLDSSIARSMSISSDKDTGTFNLHIQGESIYRHDHKMIWLPPEFRPYGNATAIRGSIMTFGHSTGNVSFW